jgi:hypothetical protein
MCAGKTTLLRVWPFIIACRYSSRRYRVGLFPSNRLGDPVTGDVGIMRDLPAMAC